MSVDSACRPDAALTMATEARSTEQTGAAAVAPPGPVRQISGNAGGFSVPQIGVAGDDLVFVWTETNDFINTIRSAHVPVEAL